MSQIILLSPDPNDKAVTGVFHEFGEASHPGEVVEGTAPPGCNGAVFRANPDGSELEVLCGRRETE
jgi:hypothetical protein